MRVETEREEDGRWIAEVIELPGVMVYGRTRKEAIASQANTVEEARDNLREALELFFETASEKEIELRLRQEATLPRSCFTSGRL